MLDHISQTITRNCYIDGVSPVLVGVSGGPDSICLLDLLHRLRINLVVAHFHHGIRPDAHFDEELVKRAALSYGIPFVPGGEPVPEFAQSHNLSIEEAARIMRYRFLFEHAESWGCQAVAVAHNADDQVETILMHLLRGSGLVGLKGMTFRVLPNPWSDSIPLIRPFLGTWRSEIETYCTARELVTVLDRTNLDTRLFRNRLRHELIPELETYIPDVRKRLWQTANLLEAEHITLNELAEQAWSTVMARSGSGYTSFQLEDFNRQPLSIRRRLVRKAAENLRPGIRDLDFAFVKRVLDFAVNPTQSRQVDVGLGLNLILEEDLLILATREAELFLDEWPQIKAESLLLIPGVLELLNGWILQVDVVKDHQVAKRKALKNLDPFQTWMDLGKDQHHILIRDRRAGDVFKPLGMGGRKMKLSDFMINSKIPRRTRSRWPLVCVCGEIAWVPGYRLAHPFRLTGEAQKVVILKVYRS